ncbi:unnamed protein product [Meganyctiphanes norvegica]|uniref:PiggyBac transposable element-derived protein 4 C-terminal zinc-finger domain-containing protein n=1 Tax=Meganyctiphanes norvegica TaxID=48144 RepID=A0AAV2RI56_MEGNR
MVDTGRRFKPQPAPSDPAIHQLSIKTPTDKKHKSRVRCRECFLKDLRKETRQICKACKDDPGLCSPACFEAFHVRKFPQWLAPPAAAASPTAAAAPPPPAAPAPQPSSRRVQQRSQRSPSGSGSDLSEPTVG